MNNTRKKKSKQTNNTLRGFAAIASAAAVLALAVFLLVPKHPDTGETRPPETAPHSANRPQEPLSPIPSNPYGPEDFAYEGDYLACMAGPAVLGVDVSSHQGEIDWEQVADAGMEFAMVRIGYRGYTSGGIYGDDWAEANLKGAAKAGLKVGAYFYSQAVTPAEAALEAAYCISLLKDYEIDLPVVFDWEFVNSDARTANMDEPTLMECTRVFCDAIADAGYQPMVYFNPSLAESLLDLEGLLDYPFWLAMYTDQMTYPHAVEMWQYTASGSVPGISGKVDINLWFTE